MKRGMRRAWRRDIQERARRRTKMSWSQAAYERGQQTARDYDVTDVIRAYSGLGDSAAVSEYGVGFGDEATKMLIEAGHKVQAAKFYLLHAAVADLTRKAESLVEDDIAEWIVDPEHPMVVGLVFKGTNKALIVVYLEDLDFEETAEFVDYWEKW